MIWELSRNIICFLRYLLTSWLVRLFLRFWNSSPDAPKAGICELCVGLFLWGTRQQGGCTGSLLNLYCAVWFEWSASLWRQVCFASLWHAFQKAHCGLYYVQYYIKLVVHAPCYQIKGGDSLRVRFHRTKYAVHEVKWCVAGRFIELNAPVNCYKVLQQNQPALEGFQRKHVANHKFSAPHHRQWSLRSIEPSDINFSVHDNGTQFSILKKLQSFYEIQIFIIWSSQKTQHNWKIYENWVRYIFIAISNWILVLAILFIFICPV
jgi:hypothetical protein